MQSAKYKTSYSYSWSLSSDVAELMEIHDILLYKRYDL